MNRDIAETISKTIVAAQNQDPAPWSIWCNRNTEKRIKYAYKVSIPDTLDLLTAGYAPPTTKNFLHELPIMIDWTMPDDEMHLIAPGGVILQVIILPNSGNLHALRPS